MKDHFSVRSEHYAKYRPGYPPGLYDFILTQETNRRTAWDCGTGNGQTTMALCGYFEKVFATDISLDSCVDVYFAQNFSCH